MKDTNMGFSKIQKNLQKKARKDNEKTKDAEATRFCSITIYSEEYIKNLPKSLYLKILESMSKLGIEENSPEFYRQAGNMIFYSGLEEAKKMLVREKIIPEKDADVFFDNRLPEKKVRFFAAIGIRALVESYVIEDLENSKKPLNSIPEADPLTKIPDVEII